MVCGHWIALSWEDSGKKQPKHGPLLTCRQSHCSHDPIRRQYSFDANTTWDTISTDARDFVAKLLTVDPEERPSAAEAMQHPWIQESLSVRLKESPLRASQTGMRLFKARSMFDKTASVVRSEYEASQEHEHHGTKRRRSTRDCDTPPSLEADDQPIEVAQAAIAAAAGAMTLTMPRKTSLRPPSICNAPMSPLLDNLPVQDPEEVKNDSFGQTWPSAGPLGMLNCCNQNQGVFAENRPLETPSLHHL